MGSSYGEDSLFPPSILAKAEDQRQDEVQHRCGRPRPESSLEFRGREGAILRGRYRGSTHYY